MRTENNNVKMVKQKISERKTVFIIFISLLLDLLSFTMILPLFPALLEHYRLQQDDWLYTILSDSLKQFQTLLGSPDKFNSVLFGGFLGSMYSFLQFIASPIIGALSDRFGRKPILIVCMAGVALSYVFWALSSTMLLFVVARFVGGICKGNISLSMAIIADVSDRKSRGHGMALVGIAFSLGFILGPIIGAGFAHWAHKQSGQWYIYPAGFAFLLAFTDLIFLMLFFNETLPKEKRSQVLSGSLNQTKFLISIKDLFKFSAVQGLPEKSYKELNILGTIYFVYLFIYSGLEFTLTFLTHHIFLYTSMQQGWMFFAIGLIMAVIQGGYVRKLKDTQVGKAAVSGLWLIIPTFVAIGLSSPERLYLLYIGIFLFALSTAFVVSCLTTIVSHYGGAEQKGTVMGIFRALGSLARAVGPIVASISFWCIGSCATYLIGAICLIWPAYHLHKNMKYLNKVIVK